MRGQLDKLTIKGFKSIRELDGLELSNLNVLVGANGAGKTNLLSFFQMLRSLIDGNLDDYVRESGGISDLLYNGRKGTDKMYFETYFEPRGYRFTLKPGTGEGFALSDEARYYAHGELGWRELGTSNNNRSLLVEEAKRDSQDSQYSKPVYDTVRSWVVYHFRDTSLTAGMRHAEIVEDNEVLRPDASNIAPFLARLREEEKYVYKEIVNVCKLVTPFLDDFLLKPQKFGPKTKVALSWKTKGSDYPMQAYHFSDGSIRFICLATALLQPDPPSSLIIDEPELGMHPEAIHILGELINSVAKATQLIVATQSPLLLDQFAIEDVIVVKRKDGQSTFERLNEEDFTVWLEDYSVGELWAKNVIVGGTSYE